MRDTLGVLLLAVGLTYSVVTLDKFGLVIAFAGHWGAIAPTALTLN